MSNLQTTYSKTEPKNIGAHGDVWVNYLFWEKDEQ
jgi:hypothetical protein